LKSALSKERGAKEAAERRAEAFRDMDHADVTRKLAKLAELEKLDPEKEADRLAAQKAQAKIEQIVKTHEEALSAERDKAERAMRGLRGRTRDSAINEALAKADVLNVEALKLKLANHLRLKDTSNPDDPFAVEVVDAAGNPLVDNKGNSLSLDAFVEQLRADPAWSLTFKPVGKLGTGAQQSAGGAKTMTRKTFEQLDPASRAETIKAGTKIVD
jgi:hypothetical protein